MVGINGCCASDVCKVHYSCSSSGVELYQGPCGADTLGLFPGYLLTVSCGDTDMNCFEQIFCAWRGSIAERVGCSGSLHVVTTLV